MLCTHTLTEQRTYEDENLDGGGEVPVGLVTEEALLLAQSGPLGWRAAVPPGRRAGGVQEIQPEVGCREIGCTVRDRRSPAPTIHVGSLSPRSSRFSPSFKAAASTGEALGIVMMMIMMMVMLTCRKSREIYR